MAYDEELADRLRTVLAAEGGLAERRMFGGLAFLLHGRLVVSASGRGGLLLRCDPAETEGLVTRSGVTRFAMRGRELDGWLHVDASAVATEEALRGWVATAMAYARSLPPA